MPRPCKATVCTAATKVLHGRGKTTYPWRSPWSTPSQPRFLAIFRKYPGLSVVVGLADDRDHLGGHAMRHASTIREGTIDGVARLLWVNEAQT